MKRKLDLHHIVRRQRSKLDNVFIIQRIENSKNLLEKCILAREYTKPQSTIMEKIVKKNLEIQDSENELSGDGIKKGVKYEIKFSIHDVNSKFNFLQIRPDHDIDFYIFIVYNLYADDNLGKSYILKIPSNIIYKLIVMFGSYAHGTYKNLGKITFKNIKGRNCEFALRPNPNSKKSSKCFKLWKTFLKYEVKYDKNNF